MDSYNHIDRAVFLDDLINTPNHQQPTSSSRAMNWTRPSHHASSSISSIASSTRSLGQVWDEQDLESMLHSDDGNMSILTPSHGDLDLDHLSSARHRSMATSSSPALSFPGSLGCYLFGPGTAPEIELTADFPDMQIPLSTSAIRQHAVLMSQGRHFLEPTLTSHPLPHSNTVASPSSSIMPMSVTATTMFLPLHHPQQFYDHQGLTTSQIPASSSSSFYGPSPMNLGMVEPHQQAAAFLSSHLLSASASPSSTLGTPANFNAMATFPSITNYLDSKDNIIDVNTSEYLSDLSSIAQQQQRQRQFHQQQRLTSTMAMAASPLAALEMQQRSQQRSQPLTYHTTTIPHTNRDTLHNTATMSTTTTTFLRPVSATNFAQAIMDHPGDSIGAGSLLPTDAKALLKRRRGRPPLDRMPSTTSLSSSLSHSTATSTSNNSSSSTLSRSSSTSSSSTSSSSSRTTTTTTPSRSSQPSPQNYFIMPPYQHSDKKLDHRSFNSRKILKQAQARLAEAEAKAEAEAEAEAKGSQMHMRRAGGKHLK